MILDSKVFSVFSEKRKPSVEEEQSCQAQSLAPKITDFPIGKPKQKASKKITPNNFLFGAGEKPFEKHSKSHPTSTPLKPERNQQSIKPSSCSGAWNHPKKKNEKQQTPNQRNPHLPRCAPTFKKHLKTFKEVPPSFPSAEHLKFLNNPSTNSQKNNPQKPKFHENFKQTTFLVPFFQSAFFPFFFSPGTWNSNRAPFPSHPNSLEGPWAPAMGMVSSGRGRFRGRFLVTLLCLFCLFELFFCHFVLILFV